MAGIFYLSAQSNPPVPGGIPDWILHGVEYFGFAVVVFRAVSGGLPAVVTRASVATSMAIVTTYAISDEVHQLFVPYRTADLRDVRSDIVGASIALVACWAWHIIATPRTHVPDVKSRH
jgi:VanZ family protein